MAQHFTWWLDVEYVSIHYLHRLRLFQTQLRVSKYGTDKFDIHMTFTLLLYAENPGIYQFKLGHAIVNDYWIFFSARLLNDLYANFASQPKI